MAIYNRVRCPKCRAGYSVSLGNKKKQIDCKCGFLIKIKAKNNYFIDYYVNGRRKREHIGTSKTLAEDAYCKRRVEIIENKFFGTKRPVRVKSYQKSATPNARLLNNYFGGWFLHEINAKNIEEFKAKRIKEVSPATVNRQLAVLKSMFNRAKDWEMYQGDNPVCKVRFFKENNERLEYLRDDEIKKMIEVSEDYFRPILVIAINTGMRLGEILALKWNDIDFQTDTIYIREAKNGKGRGERRFDLRKPFAKALKEAGITRHFRFHDLRHTFASHLAMKEIGLNTIRELLGHETLEMTMRYSHLSPEHNRYAVSVLEDKK